MSDFLQTTDTFRTLDFTLLYAWNSVQNKHTKTKHREMCTGMCSAAERETRCKSETMPKCPFDKCVKLLRSSTLNRITGKLYLCRNRTCDARVNEDL